MRYTIRHVTRFTYQSPISESVMEVRMQPRTEERQRCVHFGLTTLPAARVMEYQDHDGNTIHHFDIPARHATLTLTSHAIVDVEPSDKPLRHRLGPGAWDQLDDIGRSGEYWEFLAPSTFVRPTVQLDDLRQRLHVERGNDPLVTARRLMTDMYMCFEYSPNTTHVDSPIDDALKARRGVCQDFAHIFIALMRPLGVPARYVSGYLFHNSRSGDRSSEGATHAWVEAFMPGLGWVGFDPTNNLIAEERHIRVAVGRDYADVPPTRGVYKGTTAVRSELGVAVRVGSLKSSTVGPVPFMPAPRAATNDTSEKQGPESSHDQ